MAQACFHRAIGLDEMFAPPHAALGLSTYLDGATYAVHQFLLLSAPNMTASVMQAQLLTDADAQWSTMMAVYALTPLALFFVLRRHLTTGLALWSAAG